MNGYTQTPVNTVIFDALWAIVLALLAFAGPQAINAIFSLSVVGLYVAYAIPIAARFLGNNDFKPGPFSLGKFVCFPLLFQLSAPAIDWVSEFTSGGRVGPIHDIYVNRIHVSGLAYDNSARYELYCCCTRRDHAIIGGVVFLPKVWWHLLVHGTCTERRGGI
jgi:amino acid transporter